METGPSEAHPSGRSASRAVVVAIVLTLVGASAITVLRSETGPTVEPPGTFFPTWSAGGVSQEVFIGRLRERDGCVFLRSLGDDHLALWPPGAGWDRGTLIEATGSPVAATSEVVTAITTSLDSRADAERLVGRIPDRCVPTGVDPFVRIFDVDRATEDLEHSVVVPDVVGLGDTVADVTLRDHVLDAVVESVPSSRADAGVVIRQIPAGDTFAEIGSPVRVLVGIGPVRRVQIRDLPPMGFVIPVRPGVRLVDLGGGVVDVLRGHRVVDNNGGPVYLRHRDAYYLLDPDARALVPVSEREAKRTYLDPPQPDLPEPRGVYMDAGHWRYVIGSPVSDDALGQWSGECGSPTAYWIHPNAETQPVTGERSLRGAPESFAMGWTPDGNAIVLLPSGLCGGGTSPAGVYLFAAPGDGRLVVTAEHASLWTTAEPAMP